MSDLIDKKRLIEYLDGEDLTYIEDFYNAIRRAPAVDAVEVVRCYKCKHWEPMNKGSLMNRNRTDGVCRTLVEFLLAERYLTEKDHFCGYGERRKENAAD